MDDTIIPLVSVCCLTYNHEQYIKQCLDGILMQKTNFPFEVLIHDDASQDGTQRVIKEYEKSNPDIICPFFQTNNQYSLGKGFVGLGIMFTNARGKYIALCEGDDYWTDPMKLQKQVDFLESHPEYSMCFHNAMEHWVDKYSKDKLFSKVEDRDYYGPELYKVWTVPTASCCLRSAVIDDDYYQVLRRNPNFCFGDILIFIACANYGKIRGMSFVGSVYRRSVKGTATATSSYKHCMHNLEIYKTVGSDYKEIAKNFFFNMAPMVFFEQHITVKERFMLLNNSIKLSIYQTIKRYSLFLLRRIFNRTIE